MNVIFLQRVAAHQCPLTAVLAALIVASIAPISSPAAMQITFTDLHPVGAGWSSAIAVNQSQQAGWVSWTNTSDHAALWSGSAASVVDLNPAGASTSEAYGISGSYQVGYARIGTNWFDREHAALWSGSAASFVDLHPNQAAASWAYDVSGSHQAGYVVWTNSYELHAALWSGTAASVVDLNPLEATESEAFGISSSHQVGDVRIGTNYVAHAALWSGTPDSFVDLHPAGANESSALSTSGSQQVGSAYFGTNHYGYGLEHAALWTGSAASFVDLHPAGANESGAVGTTGAQQAGYVSFGTNYIEHAALWFGTAASFVDLHAVLGPDYSGSYADRMWRAGSILWIAGRATPVVGAEHAILWKVVMDIPDLGQAVDAPELHWSCIGDADWVCQSNEMHWGDSAAKSGRVSHGQTSCLEATVVGPGTLTFWWRVSSETNYDFLTFYGSGHWADISGETGWQLMSFKISKGPQTLQWAYNKDGEVSAGEDAAWLDQVTFTPFQLSAPRWDPAGIQQGVTGTPAGNYVIYGSTNLRDWTPVSTNAVPFGGLTNLNDPASRTLSKRFYRAQQQ